MTEAAEDKDSLRLGHWVLYVSRSWYRAHIIGASSKYQVFSVSTANCLKWKSNDITTETTFNSQPVAVAVELGKCSPMHEQSARFALPCIFGTKYTPVLRDAGS